jgi:hypothetical protein
LPLRQSASQSSTLFSTARSTPFSMTMHTSAVRHERVQVLMSS